MRQNLRRCRARRSFNSFASTVVIDAPRFCSSSGAPASSTALKTSSSGDVTQHRYKVGDIDPELRAPLRATGLFKVKDLEDQATSSVAFHKIDVLESDALQQIKRPRNAIVAMQDEDAWQQRLQFDYLVLKTPKHLSWAEFGREVECLECDFELDTHRPEEIFKMSFFFRDRRTGVRDLVWEQRNDVAQSSGLPDFLAAIGSCLGRADVHRTIRFDDGVGSRREINIRKNSAYTSEVVIAFRPTTTYNLYEQVDETMEWEKALEQSGGSGWGFHPSLMDPENRDLDDPVGTYKITLSAHALSIIILRALDRLLSRPLKEFYRPSQVARCMKTSKSEHLGLYDAIAGWIGADEKKLPHWTPIEAIQDHWFGPDTPFCLVAIINKMREMTYLKKQNPEFLSWMSVRKHDAAIAARNVRLKLMGAGASPLFAPLSHNATVNRLLPREQRRDLKASVSLAGAIGMPDETRKIAELKRIAESGKLIEPGAQPAEPPQPSLPGADDTVPPRSS